MTFEQLNVLLSLLYTWNWSSDYFLDTALSKNWNIGSDVDTWSMVTLESRSAGLWSYPLDHSDKHSIWNKSINFPNKHKFLNNHYIFINIPHLVTLFGWSLLMWVTIPQPTVLVSAQIICIKCPVPSIYLKIWTVYIYIWILCHVLTCKQLSYLCWDNCRSLWTKNWLWSPNQGADSLLICLSVGSVLQTYKWILIESLSFHNILFTS